MAKTLLLKAEVREHIGSKHAAQVRAQGMIPAIVYGHKKAPEAIAVNAHDFIEGLHHGHRLMDVQVGKKKEKMLVKDLQYDHLGRDIIHADLVRVDVTEVVRVSVALELKGTPKGAEEGGILDAHADSLEVECRVTEIPDGIVMSVKEMEVGDALYARDAELPEGVKLASDPDMLLAACHVVTEAPTTEEVEAEEPAAPEVIGEAGEEEEGEGGQESEEQE